MQNQFEVLVSEYDSLFRRYAKRIRGGGRRYYDVEDVYQHMVLNCWRSCLSGDFLGKLSALPSGERDTLMRHCIFKWGCAFLTHVGVKSYDIQLNADIHSGYGLDVITAEHLGEDDQVYLDAQSTPVGYTHRRGELLYSEGYFHFVGDIDKVVKVYWTAGNDYATGEIGELRVRDYGDEWLFVQKYGSGYIMRLDKSSLCGTWVYHGVDGKRSIDREYTTGKEKKGAYALRTRLGGKPGSCSKRRKKKVG